MVRMFLGALSETVGLEFSYYFKEFLRVPFGEEEEAKGDQVAEE